MHLTLHAAGPEDTRAVGEALASFLQPGDAAALTGELGAGKTTLVQGIARGLGVKTPVLSPTFTLVREYRDGRLPVYHVDVYRLERVQEVIDLGLEDAEEDGGVLLVEWGDVVQGLLPQSYLLIELTSDPETEVRRLVLTQVGPGWAARWERLEGALEEWMAA